MQKFTFLASVLLVAMVMTSCSGNSGPLLVTFTGEGCSVSGPTKFPTGEHTFIFKDLSDKHAYFFVRRFENSKTLQDLLDLQSYPGEYIDHPSWVVSTRPLGYEWNESTEEFIGTYDLAVEGEYGVTIGTMYDEVWICAPFKVK
jgi:hypothetical protein